MTDGLRSMTAQWSSAFQNAGYCLNLLFEAFRRLGDAWLRRDQLSGQILLCAYGGFPVTMIVALFTGFVLTLQAGYELAKLGQEGLLGMAISVTMVREMGPVMTGFILAGLIGSTMAAELGTMRVSEEIDALEVMSINPMRYLVMPRVLAMFLVCPALTIYADIVGTVGGGIVAQTLLGVDLRHFLRDALDVLKLEDLTSGLIKPAVFGPVLAVVGCGQGLQAEGGAAGVGHATMRAVVVSFMLILVIDYFITWFFQVLA